MRIRSFIFLSLVLGLCKLSWSQMVNTGELYLSSGTKLAVVDDIYNAPSGDLINDGELFVYANFSNDGMVDFMDGGSYVNFLGGAQQLMSTSESNYIRFSNVLLNNSFGFELNGEIRVERELFFLNGVVQSDDGLLVFEEGAAFNGVSNDSHVDGKVMKLGNESFEYPVGDQGHQRSVYIGGHEGTSSGFTVEYFFESPDDNYPLTEKSDVLDVIDGKEYWVIDRDSGEEPVTLTLSWDESTTPSEIFASPETNVHVARWDVDEGRWIDEGGVVDEADKTITTVALDEYGVFTLARVSADVIIDDKLVYNLITPNGDGKNDYFFIDELDKMPNNNVQIFNRWSIKVFETNEYDTHGNVFDGFSENRFTLGGSGMLPAGTYYYLISYDYEDGDSVERIKKVGYLYLEY